MIANEVDAGLIQATIDRRQDPRYAPGDASTFLGWWENKTFRAEVGTLRNVSRGGAAVEFDCERAVPDEIWLCVVGPGRVTWIPARLVGRCERTLRIHFAEPIAYETFELLL